MNGTTIRKKKKIAIVKTIEVFSNVTRSWSREEVKGIMPLLGVPFRTCEEMYRCLRKKCGTRRQRDT